MKRQKRFSVIKHVDAIRKRETARKPSKNRGIIQQETDLVVAPVHDTDGGAAAAEGGVLTTVLKNNPFRPFTEDQAPLVAALKNFYTDACAVLYPAVQAATVRIASYLEPADRMRKWIATAPRTRFHIQKLDQLERLVLPSDATLDAVKLLCDTWAEVQEAALSVIIYKTTPPRAPAPLPDFAVTWSPEKAAADGASAIGLVCDKFAHMAALLAECRRQMDVMTKVISKFFEQPRATFRIPMIK